MPWANFYFCFLAHQLGAFFFPTVVHGKPGPTKRSPLQSCTSAEQPVLLPHAVCYGKGFGMLVGSFYYEWKR